MLNPERDFLAILETVWPKLLWRKWSFHRSIPKNHPWQFDREHAREVWYQSVEAVIDLPEGAFRVSLRLDTRNGEYSDTSDPLQKHHYFLVQVEDVYVQYGKKRPMNVQMIEPGDQGYETLKRLFFNIRKQAIECTSYSDTPRSEAAANINRVFRSHFALV